MTPGVDQEALVRAARAGDRAALATLHRRFAPFVHGILLAHGPHREIEDLVQEVFVRMIESLPRVDDPARFGAWLAGIARHVATDALRRRRVREDHLPRLASAARAPRPPDPPDVEEARRLLETIRSLPDAYRETLVLRLVEGLTGPQIAAATGMSHGSVRVNLHRGMARLQAVLSQGEGARTGVREGVGS